MRWSRYVRVAVAISMAGALVGGMAGSAMAKPHGTFSVTPNAFPPGTASTFSLNFTPSQGSTSGASGDNLQCMVYTLNSFTGATLASPPSNLPGWTGAVSGPDSNVVTVHSDGASGHQLHKAQLLAVDATATAPAVESTYTW